MILLIIIITMTTIY